ncbi:MAG: polysaccharide pyruvyl transferase family protein [Alistipes sp.]|nr:polysaccharide pyruvyl transferase family protein [Alistipes sp.]
MKIGILTQALHCNYGGLLQNYALQTILKRMGHEPITIDRHIYRSSNWPKTVAKWLIRYVKPSFEVSYLSEKQRAYLASRQRRFVDNNIRCSEPLYKQADFDAWVAGEQFGAYVVGSDQVWRPRYSANIKNYFLDFAADDVKKVAYAASFGVDHWEYSAEITPLIAELAQKFDAISVREHSAVDLCSKYLHVRSKWVLDPTMLLGADDYKQFVSSAGRKSDYVVTYFLEKSAECDKLVERVKTQTNTRDVVSNDIVSMFERGCSLKDSVYLSVEDWISNIYYSSVVVTDSFHGAVFSILFNKPFVVKLNGTRGNTRLESLLSDFGLTDCLCSDIEHMKVPTIDWTKVNARLNDRRNESIDFLRNALEK